MGSEAGTWEFCLPTALFPLPPVESSKFGEFNNFMPVEKIFPKAAELGYFNQSNFKSRLHFLAGAWKTPQTPPQIPINQSMFQHHTAFPANAECSLSKALQILTAACVGCTSPY